MKERLDVLLVNRGLAPSREKAKKSKGIKKKPDYSTIQIVSTKEEDN